MPAAITGTVFYDTNADGIQNNNESTAPGVAVSFTPEGGSPVTGTTDNFGHYTFTEIAPGNYTVAFTSPTGYSVGNPVTVVVGTDNVGVGAGLIENGVGSGSGSGSGVGSGSGSGSSSNYAQYLAAAAQASIEYNAAIAAAVSTLNNATTAGSPLAVALSSALANATANNATLQSSADAATSQAFSTFTTAYDVAYNTFSANWAAAGTNQAALQQAVDDYNATVGTAYGLWQASFNAATVAAGHTWDAATNAALAVYTSTANGAGVAPAIPDPLEPLWKKVSALYFKWQVAWQTLHAMKLLEDYESRLLNSPNTPAADRIIIAKQLADLAELQTDLRAYIAGLRATINQVLQEEEAIIASRSPDMDPDEIARLMRIFYQQAINSAINSFIPE